MKKKLCHLILSLFLMVFGGFVSYFILKGFFPVGLDLSLLYLILIIPTVLLGGVFPLVSGILLFWASIIKKEEDP